MQKRTAIIKETLKEEGGKRDGKKNSLSIFFVASKREELPFILDKIKKSKIGVIAEDSKNELISSSIL